MIERYSLMIWLPAILGVIYLASALTDRTKPYDAIIALAWFAVSAAALHKRRNKKKIAQDNAED